MQLSFGSSVVLMSRVKHPKDSPTAARYLEICSPQDKFLILTIIAKINEISKNSCILRCLGGKGGPSDLQRGPKR